MTLWRSSVIKGNRIDGIYTEGQVEDGKLGKRRDGRKHNPLSKEIAMNQTTVRINHDLYRRVEEFIHATHAFGSVNEYINFLLETLFLPEEKLLSSNEQQMLSERLRALGYLE